MGRAIIMHIDDAPWIRGGPRGEGDHPDGGGQLVGDLEKGPWIHVNWLPEGSSRRSTVTPRRDHGRARRRLLDGTAAAALGRSSTSRRTRSTASRSGQKAYVSSTSVSVPPGGGQEVSIRYSRLRTDGDEKRITSRASRLHGRATGSCVDEPAGGSADAPARSDRSGPTRSRRKGKIRPRPRSGRR